MLKLRWLIHDRKLFIASIIMIGAAVMLNILGVHRKNADRIEAERQLALAAIVNDPLIKLYEQSIDSSAVLDKIAEQMLAKNEQNIANNSERGIYSTSAIALMRERRAGNESNAVRIAAIDSIFSARRGEINSKFDAMREDPVGGMLMQIVIGFIVPFITFWLSEFIADQQVNSKSWMYFFIAMIAFTGCLLSDAFMMNTIVTNFLGSDFYGVTFCVAFAGGSAIIFTMHHVHERLRDERNKEFISRAKSEKLTKAKLDNFRAEASMEEIKEHEDVRGEEIENAVNEVMKPVTVATAEREAMKYPMPGSLADLPPQVDVCARRYAYFESLGVRPRWMSHGAMAYHCGTSKASFQRTVKQVWDFETGPYISK